MVVRHINDDVLATVPAPAEASNMPQASTGRRTVTG
jgi:hypothetical protein